MTDQLDLAPCPFCGAKAHVQPPTMHDRAFRVSCTACDAKGPAAPVPQELLSPAPFVLKARALRAKRLDQLKLDAATLWNRRVPKPPPPGEW